MINRERKSEDEIPSGDTTITRIPQRQSGFATGTFEVAITDNFDPDMGKFRENIPRLTTIPWPNEYSPPGKNQIRTVRIKRERCRRLP
jgi:hypothetical protein